MTIRFSQLAAITGGNILAQHADSPVTRLLLDSRKAIAQSGALFFAIAGEHHDGHHYIQRVYDQGIRQFVVEQSDSLPPLQEANTIVVSAAVDALQKIAAHHRSAFSIPVIGITGSNGKTITKEWLYQLLSPDFTIAKNPGSYNSQIGVPLSVWHLQSQHHLGIFEAGISRQGEMEKLAAIIQPTLGIFTNLGSAHDEGFRNQEEKGIEKLKLFGGAKRVIFCNDQANVTKLIEQAGLNAFSWGFNDKATVKITERAGQYHLQWEEVSFTLRLPFRDHASIENCFHCVAAMLLLGIPASKIQERINALRAVAMRLELKEGINQCQLVDDTYNNDLGGLQISLDFLQGQQQKKKHSLILSDILESGLADDVLTQRIAKLVSENNIHRFIGIGPVLLAHQKKFPPSSLFFENTTEFLNTLDTDLLRDEVILIKGARVFEFEKIVNRLQRKVHGTVMEIDLGNVVHNLNYFKSGLKSSTKIMVMVKAFAYGSGSTEIANVLQYHKVDYLGVAYADEGVELRKNNITLPIMVMNPSEESFGTIVSNSLEPELYNFKVLYALLDFLKGENCTVHLKLDTGMHRLGFEPADVSTLTEVLKSNPNLRVASIFSHLSGADEAEHDSFSNEQAERFTRGATIISEAIGYKPLYHILNSPGILRLPELQLDMVRLGIGLYGVDPTSQGFAGLKPVATLKTIISQIKIIPEGETIGYSRRGKAEKTMRLATIAIGYADGFSRAFSRGKGEVLVHGKRAKVVGNVCMDMTMIDITDIEANEGDEVIIFGTGLPIRDVAAMASTIPYEILTNASERVKRIFVAESI